MAKQQSKPQAQPDKKVAAKSEPVLSSLIPEPLAKKIFYGIAGVLFVWMLAVSHQYGISGDENFHRTYGHHIINWYATLGEDTTASSKLSSDSLMVFYGGLYDGTATLIAKSMPSVNEWDVRHGWNSIFGFFAMFCAGLVAVEIMGWQAGILTLVFMAFSPRFFGESMNNPKDITMTTGYMFAYIFILKFIKQLPKPSWKIAIGLGVSIAVAMGIRIGGLLLIPYAFMFWGLMLLNLYGFGGLLDFSKFKDNIWPSLKMLLVATLIGYFGSLIFWPYGLMSPLKHPFMVLAEAQKYTAATIRFLFDGKFITSAEVPWNYIPQWLAISTPLFGLLGLALSLGLIFVWKSKEKLLMLGFIYFTLLFPIVFVIYKKSPLYDSMRHLFFVYPSIVILAALAFDYLIKLLPKAGKYATVAVVLVLIALPARFMFANHPNEYVYFNELEGGIKGAFGNYETDYYMNSVKQCADWLKTQKLKRDDGRKTNIYTNAMNPMNQYFKDDTAITTMGYISYRNRTNPLAADYMILYCRFVDRNILLNNAFPPEQAVYTVYADGVPLSCVIKKDDKRDMEGQELMGKNDFAGAIALLEPYVAKYPKNDVALSNLGLCYLNVQRFDDAIKVLTEASKLNSENTNAGYWMGLAYMYKGDFSNAAMLLQNVINENPGFPPPYRALSECLMRLGNQEGAAQAMEYYRRLGGN